MPTKYPAVPMIAQVLDREFVLREAERIQAALAANTPPARRGVKRAAPVVPAAQKNEARAALKKAHAREKLSSSGQTSFQPKRRRGVEPPASIDRQAFISHDPVLSLVQTALEMYFRDAKPGQVDTQGPTTTVRRGRTAPASLVTTRRLFDRFGETDPGWVASAFAMLYGKFKGKHKFPPLPAAPLRIGNNARLIIVGDWGSGIPRANKIGDLMRATVEAGIRDGREQHVVHLGDVYYSGWESEYKERLLPKWPVQSAEKNRIGSWSLNGNHDMYTGGHAYFDFLLAEPRFAPWHQGSSVFGLVNDHWDIFGLDTAYEDEGLQGGQADWVAQHRRDTAKTLFLSHHQLFSAYEGDCPLLAKKLKPITDTRPIDAWFWGHEHRLVVYKPLPEVRNARLVGHGGVPVYMPRTDSDPVKPPALREYRGAITKGLERFAKFGYAIVDFDQDQLKVQYISEDGNAALPSEVIS